MMRVKEVAKILLEEINNMDVKLSTVLNKVITSKQLDKSDFKIMLYHIEHNLLMSNYHASLLEVIHNQKEELIKWQLLKYEPVNHPINF